MNDAPDPRMQGYNQPTEPVPPPDRRPYGAGGAYSQSQRESYVDPAGNRVENSVQFVEDRNQRRAYMRYWVTAVTYFILGVLEVI